MSTVRESFYKDLDAAGYGLCDEDELIFVSKRDDSYLVVLWDSYNEQYIGTRFYTTLNIGKPGDWAYRPFAEGTDLKEVLRAAEGRH